MRERTGKHHLTWISGLIILAVTGGIVWLYAPGQLLIEMAVLTLIWFGVWMVALPMTGKKIAGLIAIGITMGLIMNRFGMLEPLTLLLLVVILVGIGSV